MTDYKPGDVALLVFHSDNYPDRVGIWTGKAWAWVREAGDGPYEGVSLAHTSAVDPQPIVALDPGKSPVRMVELLREDGFHFIADQIEAQTKPPKPTEPTGLGAVVEDSEGHLWVRAGSDAHVALKNCWRATAGEYVGDWQTFDRIDVVRVLSEGVA